MQIGIIGHFGGEEIFLDGQTIKTKNLDELLKNHGYDTYHVDTYFRSHNPLKLVIKTFSCILRCKKIFILLSVNGMNFYLPFLHYVNIFFKRDIYHYVIGSELLTMVRENPKLVRYLNSLSVNWFEYDSGSKYLRLMGVNNVETLSNCKYLKAVDLKANMLVFGEEPFRFCTFSRVMREKGITEAAKAIAEINFGCGKKVAYLDIYGQVDDSYKEEFDLILEKYKDCVRYRGLVDSDKSVDILKNYYALLFPTHWEGEGFPGTILDAFASGLPVIASDWNANGDLVKNGVLGIIYPSEKAKTLREAIELAIDAPDEMCKMRYACRNEYDKYTPEAVFAKIQSKLQ